MENPVQCNFKKTKDAMASENTVLEFIKNGEVFKLNHEHFKNRFMTQKEMIAIFNFFNAFWQYEGEPRPGQPHALLKGGGHSNGFVACKNVLQYPAMGELFAYEIFKKLGPGQQVADVVVSSAYSAITLGYELAKIISRYNSKVEYREVEKNEKGNPTIIRGNINCGKTVLIVNELMTTSDGSTWETKQAVLKCNGENPAPQIIGESYVLVHRSKDYKLKDGSPVVPIFHFDMKDVDPEKEECKYCKASSKAIRPKEGNNWNIIHGKA